MFDSEEQRETILSQMKRVRDSGEVNMMDVMGVKRVADRMNLNDLASFLDIDPMEAHSMYAKLLSEFEKFLS